ncbi:MAG: hydrogenase maturation nickel metallochaperone HypA [Clostridiales Family XIII bacterium]|jgi:hydrogenase nickel incorporation protein HypA/HybF|nr:hydrogenase maturation nickel metallochaperone HypA [Clostridiales Family XIII bacterium]
MHEYPITEKIVDITKKHGEKFRASKIGAITLVVGEQSGFIGESIQMYFDIIAEGTICEGAQLTIKGVKPQLKCSACGAFFVRAPLSFACPQCGGDGEPTEIGKEFYIESITIETEEEEAAGPDGEASGVAGTGNGEAGSVASPENGEVGSVAGSGGEAGGAAGTGNDEAGSVASPENGEVGSVAGGAAGTEGKRDA